MNRRTMVTLAVSGIACTPGMAYRIFWKTKRESIRDREFEPPSGGKYCPSAVSATTRRMPRDQRLSSCEKTSHIGFFSVTCNSHAGYFFSSGGK